MKERRKIKDRRVKPPKQGLPGYYDRHTPERRRYSTSPEDNRVEYSNRDITSRGMAVKSVKEVPGS